MALAAASVPFNERDYQGWGADQLMNYFVDHRGNPLLAMPTGTGKSVMPPLLVKRAVDANLEPGRVAILTHVKELLEQNEKAFKRVMPHADLGVVSAGLDREEYGGKYTIAGIASVFKKAEQLGPINLCFIDEAHTINHKDEGMYRELFAAMLNVNKNTRFVGLTATPFRMGGGTLLDGASALFTDMAVDMTETHIINWFVSQGYLVPLVEKRTEFRIDLTGVSTVGGEFNLRQLQDVSTKNGVTERALLEAMGYGMNRRKWLVFCAGIEHAQMAQQFLISMGIPTGCVHSKMKDAERDEQIKLFRMGAFRAMTNNGVLTTGYDDADIDLIICLRGTKSSGLWVQMLGRGTRPLYVKGFDLSTQAGRLASILASPKQNCLVLDYAGNILRCGPFNDPLVPKPRGKGPAGEAPVRCCPACNCYSHASAKVCVVCGEPFKENVNIATMASSVQIMVNSKTETKNIATVDVSRVEYSKHSKLGKPDSLMVSYYAGLIRYRSWWCFEHGAWPRQEARKAWRRASGGTEPPETIDEALERVNELQMPAQLRVWIKQPNSDVLAAIYAAPPRH